MIFRSSTHPLLSEQIIMPNSIRCQWEEIFPGNKKARLEGLEPPTRYPDFVEVVGREFVGRCFRPAHPPAHDLPNMAFISEVGDPIEPGPGGQISQTVTVS